MKHTGKISSLLIKSNARDPRFDCYIIWQLRSSQTIHLDYAVCRTAGEKVNSERKINEQARLPPLHSGGSYFSSNHPGTSGDGLSGEQAALPPDLQFPETAPFLGLHGPFGRLNSFNASLSSAAGATDVSSTSASAGWPWRWLWW